jgi:hypothetical protein
MHFDFAPYERRLGNHVKLLVAKGVPVAFDCAQAEWRSG